MEIPLSSNAGTPQGNNDDPLQLSSHERKELERKQKEEDRRKEQKSKDNSAKTKKYMFRGGIILVVALLGYWFYYSIAHQEKPFTAGEVHWHTKLDMSVCGFTKNLPRAPVGASHFGNALLHTHDDDVVHVEGRVIKKDQITLGEFFDAINVHFDKGRFFDKKNGDLCDGKPSKVKVFLDGKEQDDPRSILSLDGQNVKITFEP